MRKFLASLLSLALVAGSASQVKAQANPVFFANKTSDGKQLGLDVGENRPLFSDGWTIFSYYVKSSDNKIVKRIGITSWCDLNGKVKDEALLSIGEYQAPIWMLGRYREQEQLGVIRPITSSVVKYVILTKTLDKPLWITAVNGKPVSVLADTNLSKQILSTVCASASSN